jgi:hypothetical protein
MMEQETPLPEQTGFSESDPIFPFNKEPALMLGLEVEVLLKVLPVSEAILGLFAPPRAFSSVGLDIVVSPNTELATDRRENMVDGSVEATERDARGEVEPAGLGDLVELAAEDVAVEKEEEDGKKTEPSTLFAFSREASFLSCNRNLEGFLGGKGGGEGRRSNGTKPAGRRVMCIECGRRCLGRQGGVGNVGVCDLKAKKLGGV